MTDRPSSTAAAEPLSNPRAQAIAQIRTAINGALYDQAAKQAAWILQRRPDDGEVRMLSGVALMKAGRLGPAAAEFQKASTTLQDPLPALRHMAHLAHLQGQVQEEVAVIRRLLPLDAANPRLRSRLLETLLKLGDYAAVVRDFETLLAANATPREKMMYAKALKECERADDAMAIYDALLADESTFEEAVPSWSGILAGEERFAKAAKSLTDRHAQGKVTAASCSALGRIYTKLEQAQLAIDAFTESLKLDPKQDAAWHDLAVLQRQVGLVAESQESFGRCLDIDPFNASALRVMGHEHKYQYGDTLFKRVTLAAAKVDEYAPPARPQVHYAIAKALEDVGDLESAFAHYARGGDLQRQIRPWNEGRMANVLAVMKKYISAQDFLAASQQGFHSNKPVFVFGMPRSGTTLLEQVIASHPQAYGAGELKLAGAVLNNIRIGRVHIETSHEGAPHGSGIQARDFSTEERGKAYVAAIEKIAGTEAARIVDKMPGNYHWVGPIMAMLPDAHLIHSQRHPVEICLSEYRIFFPDGIPFSYNLRDLGKAYRQYLDYISYWNEVLPKGRILHVRYEDMVANLEVQARKIIDHIGLPWDDACLRFYETERNVKTASVTQVRKPIYTSSVNRWRKYEPYLKPLLDELGPIVKAYEDELQAADAAEQA